MNHPLRIGQLKGHESRVFDARFGGTEGNCVASVGADKRLLLWRRDGPDHGNATWRKAATLTGAHDSEITRVEWHSSGGRVFSGGADGRVCIWDLRRMCRQGEPQELGGGAVHALHAARGLVFAAAAGGGDHQLAERAVYPV